MRRSRRKDSTGSGASICKAACPWRSGCGRSTHSTSFSLRQSLHLNGKPAKVALTAVMRKLTILLNRLLKNPHFNLVS